MKKNFFQHIFLLLGLLAFSACNEEELILKQEQITAPKLETTLEASYSFIEEDAEKVWDTLSWTPVMYSQPVAVGYKIQVSLTEDFIVVEDVKTILQETTTEILVKEINQAAVQCIGGEATGPIFLRILGGLADHKGEFITESVWSVTEGTTTFEVTTFNTEPPSITKVGSANGWNILGTEFKLFQNEFHENTYENTLEMMQDEQFKIVGVPGSWDDQINFNNVEVFAAEGLIGNDDGDNIKYTGATGKQLVTIERDLAKGTNKLFIGKRLYMVGSGNGWNSAAQEVRRAMMTAEEGVYTITIDLLKDEEFKFVPVLGDWSTSYGGKDGAVTGDNIKVEADGTYTITLDLNANTYTMIVVE